MEKDAAQDTLLAAKLNDAVRTAREGRPHFIGFLDERQAALASLQMRRASFENYLLWGGWADAERVLFGAFPEYLEPGTEEFPLETVTVKYRACDELSHRDFLGALLSRGVTRETIGDILVEPGRAVLFLRTGVSAFLTSQTEKIGRVGVRFCFGAEEPFPVPHAFAPFSGVVASARLDCITAAAAGLSREKAAGLIEAGLVMVNHAPAASVSLAVEPGDKLSVRGKGRYVLDAMLPTKKGRLRIEGRQYV